MDEYLDAALEAAKAAAEIQESGFRKLEEVDYKGVGDLVTEIDYKCEDMVRERLLDEYPDHSVLGEERGVDGESHYRWLVDPLDGTTNYVHGVPHYCVSIALEIDGELEVGLVYHTPTHEAYTAIRGRGAELDGKTISVTGSSYSEALFSTGFTPGETVGQPWFEVLRSIVRDSHGVRRFGAASYDLICVAEGTVDCFYERGLYPWDMAAGILIVREAGGMVTDFDGSSEWSDIIEGDMVASNGVIHPDFLDLYKKKNETRS